MLWLPGGSESFSPVFKIPLLFSSAYLVYRAVSPPNPLAEKSATVAYDGKHDTLSATATWMAVAGVARVRRTLTCSFMHSYHTASFRAYTG